jgi:putative ABC transport system substrate-binding protein
MAKKEARFFSHGPNDKWRFMMRERAIAIGLLSLWLALPLGAQTRKHRIFVVSSYHREYLWSQDTQKGVCAGLLEFGFLDNADQAAAFTRTDAVESSACVLKKTWMDTKRKNSKSEIALAVDRVMGELSGFRPDLVLLGDDNAANYIGNQLVDTKTPVVFWGINGLPLRYGLLDSLEKPGHNITGIYQPGYLQESLEFLKRVVPGVKTFAVLSDDSETGRAKVKTLESLHKSGKLPIKLVESVVTNRLEEWKSGAIRLKDNVDAFFVTNHNSLKDENGRAADQLEIGAWYLRHIRIPECADEKQFAQEGMLCTCDDSGYNQGYEAMKLVCRILQKGERPQEIEVKAPLRGPFIVNRERAQVFGIVITQEMGVEETIEKSLALEKVPDEPGGKR